MYKVFDFLQTSGAALIKMSTQDHDAPLQRSIWEENLAVVNPVKDKNLVEKDRLLLFIYGTKTGKS